jgi:hypothetical protein
MSTNPRPTRSSRIAATSNIVAAATALNGSHLASSQPVVRDLVLVRQKQMNLTGLLLNLESNLVMTTSMGYSFNFDDDVLFPPGDPFFLSSSSSSSSSSNPNSLTSGGADEGLLLKQLDNLTDYIGSKGIMATTQPPVITVSSSSSSSERLRR